MNDAPPTFLDLMEDALQKSLPELALVARAEGPKSAAGLLQARLCFTGKDLKAQAFLSCSESFLKASCPLAEDGKTLSAPVLRDWLGELGNLILGRLKNRLLAHDVTIRITAPDFAGDWTRPDTAESLTVWFANEAGFIGFECLIEGEVPVLGESLPQKAEILPGDAIYRLNDSGPSNLSVDLLSKIRSGTFSEESEEVGIQDEDAAGEPMLPALPSVPQAPGRAFPIHFHSNREKSVAPKGKTALTGIAWPSLDRLQLRFSSGLEANLCPKTLLEQGTHSLEIEGFKLELGKEGDMLRISLPRLQISLTKSLRQAS